MQTYTIDIRPRRQTTLPKSLLNELGVDVGDKLVAEIKNKQVILKPRKQLFLDTLKELQRMVKESGIPEKEMQDNLRKIRKELYEERYSSRVS